MSKSHALKWAIVCGIVAGCCYLIQGLAVIGTSSLIVCACFLLYYGYKLWSHQIKVAEAKAAARKEPVAQTIEMTSPGSSRLFVPPPLAD